MTDSAEEIGALYHNLCEAIFGHRKEIAASALTVMLAEVCLLGVSEETGLSDARLVASALTDNIRKLAFVRSDAVTGTIN
jgi:hypothetical protein